VRSRFFRVNNEITAYKSGAPSAELMS
jgi:hypothetical protein